MPRIVRRAAAKRDLILLTTRIVEMHEGKFRGVRMCRVTGFENVLIFYRPLPDGVAIERVFDAKRDYQRVLK